MTATKSQKVRVHATDVIVRIASVLVLNNLKDLLLLFSECELFVLAKARRANRFYSSEVCTDYAVLHR